MGATIETMRQELRKNYQEIVGKYIEEGWGIYDDSSNMNRAICLSDAYYGDWSSLLHLYKKIGKYIMIQSI